MAAFSILVSQFTPHASLRNDFEFNYSSHWQSETRFDHEGIFHRRWESLNTYETAGLENKFPVEEKLGENFEIVLSIRTPQEAHIRLIDESNATRSNFYWILLGGYGGTKTQIQRILKGGKVATVLATVNHSDKNNLFLTSQEWRHFKLSKLENRLSIAQLNPDVPIINASDNEEVFNVTQMVISSSGHAAWKIHTVRSLFTENVSAKLQINKFIEPENGVVCIAIFARACESCKLTLILSGERNEGGILSNKTYTPGVKWREIKFSFNISEPVVLSIVISARDQKKLFWFIDENIRQCHDTEYRLITSKRKSKCQLLSDGHNAIISLDDGVITPASNNNNCGPDTVTRSCIPCSLFLNETCGHLKVCEKRATQIECSCSAGWKNGDDKCESQCDSGFYGRNCIQQCGHCFLETCNHVDGTCNLCSDDYFGPKCDKERLVNPQNLTFPQNLQNDLEHTRQYHTEAEETIEFLNTSLITLKENDSIYKHTSDPIINDKNTKGQNSTKSQPFFLIPVIIFVFIIVIIFRKKLYLNIFNENHQKWLNTLKVICTIPNKDSTKQDGPVPSVEGDSGSHMFKDYQGCAGFDSSDEKVELINVNRNAEHSESDVVLEVPNQNEADCFWQSVWNTFYNYYRQLSRCSESS